jgi:hypothetical protein
MRNTAKGISAVNRKADDDKTTRSGGEPLLFDQASVGLIAQQWLTEDLELKGTPAEYKAGLLYAIEKGWLELHESGTFVRFTEAGAALFA